MTRFKRLLIAGGILLLLVIGLSAYDVVGRSFIEARAAATGANLNSIGRKIAEFRATRGRFPQDAAELGLQPDMLMDIVSGKSFVWTQKAPDGTERVRVVWQPAPYRTEPWPFGEIKQAALYSDGTIGDCLSENAAH
jgi:hypothetical protein